MTTVDLCSFPPQHKIRVRPDRIRYLDGKLRCWVQTVVGIRATCSCGETSGRCKSWSAARDWKIAHAATHPSFEQVTIAGPLGDRPEMA